MAATPNVDISVFARSNFRNELAPIGIRTVDRLSHMYVIGQTGVGKSTLLETLVRQDISAQRGLALIDPHGELVERIATNLTPIQRERVVYLNATDPNQPFGYNPLRRVRQDKIPLAVSGLMETLKKLWPDAWGVRMEHVLRNSLYALLERNDSTLPDILRLYSDDEYRKSIVVGIKNDTVRHFWLDEFENYPSRLRAEACAPIQNKLGALLSDPMLHRLLVRPTIDLHMRQIMDEGKVLLVNVSKGQMGEDSSHLLGALVLSTLSLAALSRADTGARKPFFIYADEFQSITTLMIATMLPELRKYGVGLILAHQYLSQLDSDIRSAVIGNVGTMISFRVGAEDVSFIAREFQPIFSELDLISLPNRSIYLRLLIDGTPSAPFSAETLASLSSDG
jgi:energy-coupling factor transporter ATP-binding protein EcfA2